MAPRRAPPSHPLHIVNEHTHDPLEATPQPSPVPPGDRAHVAAEAGFTWPPSPEDLAAIEIIELPTAAANTASPPDQPRAVLVDALALDARDGPTTYLVELRTASADTTESTTEETTTPVDGRPLTPKSTAAESRSVPRPGSSAAPPLDWPPKDVDLAAIHVLDLEAESVQPVVPQDGGALRGSDEEVASHPAGPAAPMPAEQVSPARDSPPRLRRAFAIGAVGLAAAGAVAVWLGPSDPADPPKAEVVSTASGGAAATATPDAPRVESPGTAEAIDPLQRARAAYLAGDRSAALAIGAELLRQTPSPATRDLVDEWLGAAQDRADAARRAALDAAPEVASAPAFLGARRLQRDARVAWLAGNLETAFTSYTEAERTFRRLAARPIAPSTPEAPVVSAVSSSLPDALVGAGATAGPVIPPPLPTAPGPASPPLPRRNEGSALAPGVAGAPVATPEPARSEVAAAVPGRTQDDAGVRRALRAYQSAYERLDAQAASAVYPALDPRALARAFDGLRSQTLEFDRCEVNVSGAAARAACVGRSAFIPKVGSQSPRVESRRWTFDLELRGEQWQITRTSIGRP